MPVSKSSRQVSAVSRVYSGTQLASEDAAVTCALRAGLEALDRPDLGEQLRRCDAKAARQLPARFAMRSVPGAGSAQTDRHLQRVEHQIRFAGASRAANRTGATTQPHARASSASAPKARTPARRSAFSCLLPPRPVETVWIRVLGNRLRLWSSFDIQ